MFQQFQLQSSASTNLERVQTNEILGSGNFEIARGGTYFEGDAHLHYLHRLEIHGYEEVKIFLLLQEQPSSTGPHLLQGTLS
jgi:hypothetical protein